MKQVRNSAFETNSSSSHSLTIGVGEMVSVPFAFGKDVLRRGEVILHVGEYGWEWHRYYTPLEKANYLLTQVCPEVDSHYGDYQQIAKDLAEDYPGIAMLIRVIEEYTGCKVGIANGSGYVDHDSAGVGTDLLDDYDKLKDFLFNTQSSYVQTGNDNSACPEFISTDKSSAREDAYIAHRAVPPKSYKLLDVYSEGWWRGEMKHGNAVIPESLSKKLTAKGILKGIAQVEQDTYTWHRDRDDNKANAVGTAVYIGFKLTDDVRYSYQHKVGKEGSKSKLVTTYSVYVPAGVYAEIRKLSTDKA